MATAQPEAAGPKLVTGAASLALAITMTASGTVTPGQALLVYVVHEPHPHVPAKHDEPVLLGTDFGLVLVALYVGWRIIGWRLLREAPPERTPPA